MQLSGTFRRRFRDGPLARCPGRRIGAELVRLKGVVAEVWSMDTGPIVRTFDALINVGSAVAGVAAAFFIMLGAYQLMTAGGSPRSLESAKSSISNALLGLVIVILCRVIANLVRGALGGGGDETPRNHRHRCDLDAALHREARELVGDRCRVCMRSQRTFKWRMH